jgi:hypothetical protein
MATSLREQSFKFHKGSKRGVSDPQITFEELQIELQKLKSQDLVMFIRTYVQERTPAAFCREPMLWEAVREWLAARLGVHPREIGLSGSAQSGFSMKSSKLGEPFNPKSSDLDLFVVNESYWSDLCKEARLFISRNSADSDYVAQAETVSKQLGMGYLDLNQILAVQERYPAITNARNEVSIVIDRLRSHGFMLKASHLRIYQNWAALGAWVGRSYAVI